MKDAECAEAVFMSIGKNERRRLARDEGWDKCANLCDSIARCLEGIRSGRYAPVPADPGTACAYCSAKRVCRYEAGRIKRKTPRGHAGHEPEDQA
jgi:hypothetical protein